jgi:glycosyltransferase involved in cell wall biosynthesis
MLGRSLCGNGENLYKLIEKSNKDFIDFDSKAYEINVHTKHQTEKTLANISNTFTTVSDLTKKETKIFFNKEPDKILYNGLNNLEESFENLILNFNKSRDKLINFTKKYFHNFYNFDIENSYFGFSSGRFEFKNKGFDIIIPALSKLNEKLKKENSNKSLIFYMPILMGKFEKSEQIIESINNYEKNIERKIDFDYAPLSTHNINFENLLIQYLLKYNLKNHKNDKVKIIIIPTNLNGTNNAYNLKYYEFIKGFDFSIFPSFYEPWGYTPEESISLGIKTLTSNISGFGLYVENKFKEKIENEKIISIINRDEDNFEKETEQLFNKIIEFINYTQKEELIMKENSFELSKEFNWEKLIKNYLELYK